MKRLWQVGLKPETVGDITRNQKSNFRFLLSPLEKHVKVSNKILWKIIPEKIEKLEKGQSGLEKKVDNMTTLFQATFSDLVKTSIKTIDDAEKTGTKNT